MKININFIYTSILFGLIVFCFVEYHNNNVLETRINSLKKNSIDFKSDKTFKEDYYITQQSHDTNLLLVVFAVLITFSGFFTYVNIVKSYTAEINEIKNESTKQKDEWNNYHNRLILLESELNFQIGLIYSDRGSTLIKDNFNDGLMMCFCSMEKFSVVGINDSVKQKKEEALKLLNFELKFLNKLIDDKDIFNINIDYRIYRDRIDRIIKVLDYEGLNMFNRITSKIRITTLEK